MRIILPERWMAMPEATLLYPLGRNWTQARKRRLIERIKRFVAENMSALDYTGTSFVLTADHVDVILTGYEQEDVSLGARYVLHLTGYDYPDRMETIEERLTAIAVETELEIGHILGPDRMDGELHLVRSLDQAFVSATFLPYRTGCYASSGGA